MMFAIENTVDRKYWKMKEKEESKKNRHEVECIRILYH